MTSFAAHSVAGTRLGLQGSPPRQRPDYWRNFIEAKAAALRLAGRVFYLDGGNLDVLAEASSGMVTVNSTAGLHALKQGRPVKVLGTAVFDIAGLTDQQPLDDFWQAPAAPDAEVSTACSGCLPPRSSSMATSIQREPMPVRRRSPSACTRTWSISRAPILIRLHGASRRKNNGQPRYP